jgi:3-methyladenine DNA glycosylase/8-oxoguanine DNA glycosylase
VNSPLEFSLELPEGFLFWDGLRFFRMGRGDPTVHLERHRFVMARWFMTGSATIDVTEREGKARVLIWGAAAEEAQRFVPFVLGLHDTPVHDFGHVRLNRMLKPKLNLRLSRSPYLSTSLLSHVLQQQIAWRDAAKIWRRLSIRHGRAADGPHSLKLPLNFNQMQTLARHHYQSAGLIENRIPLLREIGRLGWRIDEWYGDSIETYANRVQRLSQMGPWTTYHALAVSMGEPDVVVTGDYTLPHTVSWALLGQPRSNDEEMKRLLGPFVGNRWRLVRLLWALNIAAPRRGPRLSSMHTRRW